MIVMYGDIFETDGDYFHDLFTTRYNIDADHVA